MKVLAVAFMGALLFLLLAGTLIVGEVQAATEVGGIITSDTTWTKANSPYNLTGNVLIESGVTLTIEADTTLNFNKYFIRVNGSLVIQPGVTLNIETVVGGGSIQVHGLINMRGTSTNPIHVNGGTYYYAWIAPPSYSSIVFSQQSIPWNEQTASGCIIENVVLSSTNIVVNNSPKITKNTFLDNGGVTVSIGSPEISNSNVYGRIEINGGSPVIASNNVKNGQIVYHTDYDGDYVTIIDNVVSYAMGQSGSTAIRIIGGSFNGGHVLIEGNLITNSDVGIDIFDPNTAYTDTSVNIQNNTIVNNIVGLSIGDRFSPIIAGNNIYDNPTSIKLYADASNDIDATYNWWGTTDNQGIEQSIIDFKEDFDLGKVTYDPFLAEPNSKAPSLTYFPVTPPLPTDSPTPTIEPTPTVEPTPSGEPTPTPEPTPTSTLTAAPTSPPIELNLLETAILIVLVVIATLLVAIIWLVMKKRR